MVKYILSDNSGNQIVIATDAVDTNANTFTIQQVTGFEAASAAVQAALGRISRIATDKATLIALAVAASMHLVAHTEGQPAGSSGDNVVSVSTQTLSTPTLAAVTGGASGQVALSWGAISNATNYVVDQATNIGFTTGVSLGVFSGSALLATIGSLTPGGTFFFRVRAQGTNYNDSATSTVQSAVAHA